MNNFNGNDIELANSDFGKTTSENIIDDINNKITMLIKLNPNYKPMLIKFNDIPTYWEDEKKEELEQRNNFEFMLNDTY